MSLGWINPEDFSFNSFLLMDRFQIRMMFDSGGWLLDCPGDEAPSGIRHEEAPELVKRGWELMQYTGTLGGEVYRYRKQVIK